ncbi:MAG: endonuclease/exonuclease/phosphatase family protein [Candidatus Cloacimonetes bacterium]|nr:endonuclease/exonuclease/phosphatase family protein [Candidatus Cloacimonadota bacterium]MCF7813105.1 endonuclease/exonuclease/phosphatase family protein [Candidatus Cloacimonadota bacterium]MCF7867553.1 endonuclease/exonuclease/phosphatase family protein [Candidatus Cloacimonadota bacterium]MCF7883053.1 endonuclease/exonuclease/phosphatase family protein [Candidatus Cloacimonadota bacterium]
MKNIILLFVMILLISCGISTEPSGKRDKPTNLKAVNTLNDEIHLNWDDNSNQEIGFLISRQTGRSEFVIIDTTEINQSEYLDDDVEENEYYIYRVAAVFDDEISDWSNEIEILHQFYFGGLEFGTDETFDVVTWNIEHFPKQNQTTVDYVTYAILGMNAEIFGLQEIENQDFFYTLVDQLNSIDVNHNWEGHRAYSASYDINLAFIYKSDLVQVIDIYEIFENDNRPFPRNPLVMNCIYDTEEYFIINNHFKASGDGIMNLNDPWDEETRRYDASNLLDDFISENLPDANVFVIGDLNDELDDNSANNVFQNLIDNSSEYLFVDMDIAWGPNNYWSYPGWPSHLDHIMITNELFDEFAFSDSSVETILLDEYLDGNWGEYDNYVSDHRPVGLNLDLEE